MFEHDLEKFGSAVSKHSENLKGFEFTIRGSDEFWFLGLTDFSRTPQPLICPPPSLFNLKNGPKRLWLCV